MLLEIFLLLIKVAKGMPQAKDLKMQVNKGLRRGTLSEDSHFCKKQFSRMRIASRVAGRAKRAVAAKPPVRLLPVNPGNGIKIIIFRLFREGIKDVCPAAADARFHPVGNKLLLRLTHRTALF
jgi:hypothetical protein